MDSFEEITHYLDKNEYFYDSLNNIDMVKCYSLAHGYFKNKTRTVFYWSGKVLL